MKVKKLLCLLLAVALLGGYSPLLKSNNDILDFSVKAVAVNLTSGDYSYSVSNNLATIEKYNGTANSITIPSSLGGYSVTKIGDYAFQNCASIKTITIGNKVTKIGYQAFYGCTGLQSITIPDSVTEISSYAFYGCTRVTTITIGTGLAKIPNKCFSECTALQQVKIGTNVTEIDSSAFSYCSALSSITWGSNLTTIGSSAFLNCIALTSLSIPNTVIKIGDYAFQNCTGIKTVTIGNKVTTIGYEAFYGCIKIKTIYLPLSLQKIQYYASYQCGITDVYYEGGSNDWYYVTLDDGNDPIKNATFHWYNYNSPSQPTTYFINFNANGGSVSPSSASVTAGNSITLPTPTRSGYTCLGWSTSSTATSASYSCGAKYTPSKNITLYAVWKQNPITTYTVTYNANGGSVSPSSASVTAGNSITLPTPTRSGYTCLGWSTSSTATSASYSCGAKYTPSKNITLYAVWQVNTAPVQVESITLNYKDNYYLGYLDFKPVKYYSDNTNVATVSDSGNIYATGRGRTYVHAVDKNNKECITEVNVEYSWWQWIIEIVLFGWLWY